MLLRSEDNLSSGVISFVKNSHNIKVFSPFIKVNMLKEIIGETNCKLIVVRWLELDLLFGGITDFEKLYYYCSENNITLKRNKRIHLKAILNDSQEVFYGSANITNKGLGNIESKPNFELSGIQDKLSADDLSYFYKIELDAELVDDQYFKELKDYVDKHKKEVPKIATPDEFINATISLKNKFLLSALPMSESPEKLFEIYDNNFHGEIKAIDLNCAAHDIANYAIPKVLEYEIFMSGLKTTFNIHPFITKLKEEIAINGSLNYGSVVNWITKNTTSVPTPRNWEVKEKQIVNILYTWICYFDTNYTWDTPGYSQIIYFKPN